MKTAEEQKPRMLDSKEVMALTGIPQGTFHRALARGGFPLPIKMGPLHRNHGSRGRRNVLWFESEVLQWIKDNDPFVRMERASYRSKEVKR